MNKDTLIQKWVLGELSEEEKKAFDAMDDASFYEDIIKDASRFKASGFSEMDDFETFKQKVMSPETKVRKLNWWQPAMRIASIGVILFGLYYFFIFNTLTEVQTLAGEKNTIELPDASQVVLNAASQVQYDEGGWSEKREIKLEGEAFFDVAKGSKFDVITPQGTISVLGTEFNVKQRGSFFEVACFEGTVRVVANGETKILKVGDNVRLTEGRLESGNQSYDKPRWTSNTSYFERIPLVEVFAELERQYGLTTQTDGIDTSILFTGGFSHDDLEQAVQAISAPLALEYEILKRSEVRFSKRE